MEKGKDTCCVDSKPPDSFSVCEDCLKSWRPNSEYGFSNLDDFRRRSSGSTIPRGVKQTRPGRWSAEIQDPKTGGRVCVGVYDSCMAAAQAYYKAAILFYGESAIPTFPESFQQIQPHRSSPQLEDPQPSLDPVNHCLPQFSSLSMPHGMNLPCSEHVVSVEEDAIGAAEIQPHRPEDPQSHSPDSGKHRLPYSISQSVPHGMNCEQVMSVKDTVSGPNMNDKKDLNLWKQSNKLVMSLSGGGALAQAALAKNGSPITLRDIAGLSYSASIGSFLSFLNGDENSMWFKLFASAGAGAFVLATAISLGEYMFPDYAIAIGIACGVAPLYAIIKRALKKE